MLKKQALKRVPLKTNPFQGWLPI